MFEYLLWRSGSAVACHRDGSSGCSRLGCDISPLGGGCHQPHHRAASTYTGLGIRLLEGTDRTLCTRTQEKAVVTPQETDPDLPVSVGESPADAWVRGGLRKGWSIEYSSTYMGSFEGSHHYLHCLHHSLVPSKQQGGSSTHQQKIGLKIY